jgi:hypothetical protein
MTEPKTKPGRSRRRRVAIVLFAAILLYLGLGYFVVPVVVEHQLLRIVSERTGRTATVEAVSFDPIRLRLSVTGFALPDPAGSRPALSFDELDVAIRPLGFLRADVALGDITLIGPQVSVAIDKSGVNNWTRLFAGRGEATQQDDMASTEPKSDEPLIIDVGSLRIEQGKAFFQDATRDPRFDVQIGPLDLDLQGFTTRAGRSSPYSLTVQIGDTTQLRWTGKIGLDPLHSEGRIDLTGFDLRLPWEYLSESLRFEVASGRLGLSFDYDVGPDEGDPKQLDVSIAKARILLEDLELRDRADDHPVLALPRVSVEGIGAKLVTGALESVSIADVSVGSGHLATHRDADAHIRLVDLFTPKPGAVDGAPKGEGVASPPEPPPTPATPAVAPSKPPEIRIDRIRVANFDVDWEDRVPATPVPLTLDGIALQIDGLRNAPGSTMSVAFSAGLGEAGSISIEGPVGLEPLSAKLAIKASAIGLAPFGPYLEDVARLEISNGALATELGLTLADAEAASGLPAIDVRGRVEIDDLKTRERRSGEPFLEWKALRLEGLEASPERVRLGEIGLENASVAVTRAADGSSNLASILPSKDTAASASGESGAPRADAEAFGIAIDLIRLDDLGVRFTDHSTKPEFEMALESLSGTIKGLSSEAGQSATVDLAGRIGEGAPLTIKGKISPLSDRGVNDVSIDVVGIPMVKLTPYSGRFVGRQIERGNLDLDLEYAVKGRILEAKNHAELHHFEFGKTVKSPEATSLPVSLAVELMRNPDGDVEIDLPIRGNLDDPSFSVLGVLGDTLVKLITRVAGTPFAVLGGVGRWVGLTGDDPGTVLFEAGSDVLSGSRKQALALLTKELAARPSLRVEIRGRADPVVDGAAGGGAGVAPPLSADAAQDLAKRRASAVQAALLAGGGVDPDRIVQLGVQVGDVAQDGGIPVSLSLSADAVESVQ